MNAYYDWFPISKQFVIDCRLEAVEKDLIAPTGIERDWRLYAAVKTLLQSGKTEYVAEAKKWMDVQDEQRRVASAGPTEVTQEPPWDDLKKEIDQAAKTLSFPALAGWRQRLIWKRDSKGNPTTLENHYVNVTEILTNDERWVGRLALNEFSQVVELSLQPPYESGHDEDWIPRPLTDEDLTFIVNWLATHHRIMVRPDVAGSCARAVAKKNSFHPVREYLESLEWDGIERLSSWLEDFCGAKATSSSANYIRNVGRAWMISAVARIYQPGCKADHVLILEGLQSIGKSTLFKTLGREWFTDQISDMGSKDASMQTQGIWIVELAELDAMSRHEVGRVKAFLTIQYDRFRPPFGHVVMRYDRQCVFAGTVNHTDYLRDDTGNRRFWPVRCAGSKIDIPALEEARDQLWAEAVAAYKAKEIWWLKDERAAREEQEERMTVDVWEDPISAHLVDVCRQSGPLLRERTYVTVPGVLRALQIPLERQGLAEARRAVSVLKRFGWLRRRVRTEAGASEWRYMAPEAETQPGLEE